VATSARSARNKARALLSSMRPLYPAALGRTHAAQQSLQTLSEALGDDHVRRVKMVN
jgi:hypothetical protein